MRRRFYVYLSTSEFARVVSEMTGGPVTRAQVYKWARSGAIPSERIGGRYYIATQKTTLAARALGVSPQTLRRRVETGERAGVITPAEPSTAPPEARERRDVRRRFPEEYGDRLDRGDAPAPPDEMYAWLESNRPDLAAEVMEQGLPLENALALARVGAPPMSEWREVYFHVTRGGGLDVVVTGDDGRTYTMRFPTKESAVFFGWNLYDKELLAQLGVQVHKRIDSPGRKGKRK